MRFLVSYLRLKNPAGTEVYALTVAEQLERLGHDAVLVTWAEGAMSERARSRGLRVVAPGDVGERSADVILANDGATLLTLAAAVPDATRVMVVHSAENTAQTPPQLPDACQAVVVQSDRLQRRVAALAVETPIVRLRHPIDLERFRLLPWAQWPPRRAAVFGHIAATIGGTTIAGACRAAGLDPTPVGIQGGTATTEPEHAIGATDVVIGIGRCALEASAARRPVYVAGPAGIDGWLRPERYAELEADGFTGMASPRSSPAVAAELRDPPPLEDVLALYEIVTREHDARLHAEQLVALARELGAPAGPPRGDVDEIARLIRLEFGARERADSAERLARNRAAVAMMRSASWRRLARSVRTRLGRRPT